MQNLLPFKSAQQAASFAIIEFEVNAFISDCTNNRANDEFDIINEEVGMFLGNQDGINLDPETRKIKDLIKAIAHLEFLAGQLKDEIMDGQYQP